MSRLKAAAAATLAAFALSLPVGIATSVAVPAVASAATVKAPKAVPGRFCKKGYAHKKTHTKKYGTLTCKKKGGRYRWAR